MDRTSKRHVYCDKVRFIPTWVPLINKILKALEQVEPGEIASSSSVGDSGLVELVGPDHFRPACSKEIVITSGPISGFHSPPQPTCNQWASLEDYFLLGFKFELPGGPYNIGQ